MRKIEQTSLSEPLRWAQLMAQARVSPPKDARPSLTSLCQAVPEITQQRCGQTQAERERETEREKADLYFHQARGSELSPWPPRDTDTGHQGPGGHMLSEQH